MKKVILTVMMFAILGLCSSAFADELQDLRTQMQNQYKAMQEIQNKLIELESKQKLQDEQIKTMGTQSKEAFQIPDSLKWAEKIKLYGDFRFRFEQIEDEELGVRNKGRARGIVRFRLGAQAKITDELTVDARFASGSGPEPTSTNFTLGRDWEKGDLWLDRAYIKWQPKCAEGLSVLVGKMGVPFYSVSNLIWDSDVNPEGVAIQYAWKINDKTEGFANGGGFWVEERGSDSEIAMWGIQAGLKHEIDDDRSLTGGVTYYDYANIKGDELMTYDGDYSRGGNTVFTDGADLFYTYDYNILELFGEYGHKMFGLPSGLYTQYTNNMASGVSADQGWLVGYRLNKAKKAGTWQISYDYRDQQRDSVLGAFAETDSFGGGIGGRSHCLSYMYKFTDNIAGTLGYWYADRAQSLSHDDGIGITNKASDQLQRVRAELIITF